jgi:MerR family redox-sensitive transcriptional activator SoxR
MVRVKPGAAHDAREVLVGGRSVTGELTVGELSARSVVAVSGLHFYERKGLITSRRTAGNQRRYPRAALRRVAVIRIAVRLGVPLVVVAEALDSLPREVIPGRADWERLAQVW